MKICVTGAAGFIGFHLIKRLLRDNHTIIGIDNLNNYYLPKYKLQRVKILKKKKNFKFKKINLNHSNKLEEVFEKNKFDCIYHLASQPGIMYSFKNPTTYIQNNIIATKNLINFTKKYFIKKFYFTSSSSVYGLKRKFPINEKAILKPMNIYAKTKLECEKILKENFKFTDIDLKIFRPFTVYGPYGRPDMIFLTFLDKLNKNKDFYLFNNGEYVRDFTYVEDVAEIMTLFLKKGFLKKNIFNICSANPIKINDLISLIEKYTFTKANIIKKPYRKGEMIKTYGDNQLLIKIIKFNNFMDINEGIKKTMKWYMSYKDKKSLVFNKIKY